MNFGIMEEIYFCAKDLNGVSGLMRLAKFDLSRTRFLGVVAGVLRMLTMVRTFVTH